VFYDLAVGPEAGRLAGMIVRTIASSSERVDRELTETTTNWRLERLGAIERCVLRIGAAELIREETPPRVVIQEGVRLAERYAGPKSARFVNGVLDALARRMGRL
jgi:N utilization substance protein B